MLDYFREAGEEPLGIVMTRTVEQPLTLRHALGQKVLEEEARVQWRRLALSESFEVVTFVVIFDENDAAHGDASAEDGVEVGHSRGCEELGSVVDGGAGAGDGGEASGAALHEGAAPRF